MNWKLWILLLSLIFVRVEMSMAEDTYLVNIESDTEFLEFLEFYEWYEFLSDDDWGEIEDTSLVAMVDQQIEK